MPNTGPRLTQEQIAEVLAEKIPTGIPVRFQLDGCTLNITTGELQPKGINVIYQTHYWRFTKETAKKIADWLNVKPIFSKD